MARIWGQDTSWLFISHLNDNKYPNQYKRRGRALVRLQCQDLRIQSQFTNHTPVSVRKLKWGLPNPALYAKSQAKTWLLIQKRNRLAVIIRDEGPNRPGGSLVSVRKLKRGGIFIPLFTQIKAAVWRPLFAERVGFKPTVRLGRTPDFESGPFDHSGIFPWNRVQKEHKRE